MNRGVVKSGDHKGARRNLGRKMIARGGHSRSLVSEGLRNGPLTCPQRSLQLFHRNQQMNLITRAGAKLSVFRPADGGVLQWELCKTP
jgi:hypothetical protein